MKQEKQLQIFDEKVESRYRIFNSLFMSLPYEKMKNLGSLLPFLYSAAKDGLPNEKTPQEIIDGFFAKYTELNKEEQTDLLFRFIQYIERQVVLFDAVEDAAFQELNSLNTSGTLSNVYQIAKREGKLDEVKNKLRKFGVRLVFTAHPTQFYPNSVLRIMQDLREAISENKINDIDKLLQQLGKTPFYKQEKPTPYDEAISIIYYLRHVYYESIGKLLNDVNDIFFSENDFDNHALIQIGFWPGGDRDGNPFVNAETTKKVAYELRYAVLKCYYKDLKKLSRKLTFRGAEEPLNNITEKVYKNMFGLSDELVYGNLIQSLEQVRKVLIEKHNSLFIEELNVFIAKVKAFGLCFASLDIRQDSSIHNQVIQAVLEKYKAISGDYKLLSEKEKLDLILTADINADFKDFDELIVRDTLENIAQIKEIQGKNGSRSIHRYIISNCESVVDVLHVYVLFKWCGYSPNDIKIDIVPLFETMRGLDNAKATMSTLYNSSPYKEHLAARDKSQTVMLGFSDGTKDGGYLKANWEIFKTKEMLTSVSRENNIEVLFFDGRGGPPARGGGKTHRFYAAQGKTIANNQIQLTIQGQTITSLYGTVSQTYSNIEQLISAGIENEVFDAPENKMSEKERDLLTSLSEDAYAKYKSLKSHEKFVPYLERMSTLPYYGKTNIGSRPSKRAGSKELTLDNLRAIPFVGSWSQLKQNVPGYYGMGTAIFNKKEKGEIDKVKLLYKESAFFKTLVLNSMMAMEKTFFSLTAYMKNNPEFSEFWTILYKEYQLSVEMVLEISGNKVLMEEEPLSKESIKMREEIVLPLLSIQQYALQNIQENSIDKEMYEKMVMRSLFGNINASRNSA